jgi:hypothetical protein
MPLVELLQWLGTNTKTGVLELERNRVSKRIALDRGRIVGCSSNDPSALLGHALLSRGKINERSLQFALKHQQLTGTRLSEVLIEMGMVTEFEIEQVLSDIAAETVYGLFEWPNAVFRFDLDVKLDCLIPADLSLDHIVMNGAHRQDELQRFREVFRSGMVLGRTDRPPPAEVEDSELVQPVLELIDGERTIAEIVLQAHASEFQVLLMLFTFQENGNLTVTGEREVKGARCALLDPEEEGEPIELPSLADLARDVAADRGERPAPAPSAAATAKAPAARGRPEPEAEEAGAEEGTRFTQEGEVDILVKFASEKLERGDQEGALTMLESCYRAQPDNEAVKKLIDRAEEDYLAKIREYLLGPDRVPVLEQAPDAHTLAELSPAESTLLAFIDGKTNVQGIVWVAPRREVDVMRALQQLHEKGLIRIEAPAPVIG